MQDQLDHISDEARHTSCSVCTNVLYRKTYMADMTGSALTGIEDDSESKFSKIASDYSRMRELIEKGGGKERDRGW